ncbi:hypothetical protein [Hymenobacter persicinus]|uniref:Entericidin n=1 Tax=Hymenobacter persicinus TaxID=2025506 RepID=A0A4Q5LGN7_9BACT|nr:hypothetical protein [Hymenobacter persicinus]RYU82845.1 hypothetical protein EWM57_03920 [Hymenobacter persicinus]
MKKLLFLALAAASFSLAACEPGGSKLEGTSDGSVHDGTVDAGIRRQDTASTMPNGSGGMAMDTTVAK